MSIRIRLLGSVSSFLTAIEHDTVDAFARSFGTLVADITESSKVGALSTEDQRLSQYVLSFIETTSLGLEQVDSALSTDMRSLTGQVDSILAADDCHGLSLQLRLPTSHLPR